MPHFFVMDPCHAFLTLPGTSRPWFHHGPVLDAGEESLGDEGLPSSVPNGPQTASKRSQSGRWGHQTPHAPHPDGELWKLHHPGSRSPCLIEEVTGTGHELWSP